MKVKINKNAFSKKRERLEENNMEFLSRIFIKVRSVKVWKQLYNINLEEYGIFSNGEELFKSSKKTFLIDGDCGLTDNEINGLVCEIAEHLGKDGFVIADSTSISSDPFSSYAYYLGEKVRLGIYQEEDKCKANESFYPSNIDNNLCLLCENTAISDAGEWINYGEFKLSKKEQDFLSEFGMNMVKSKRGTFFDSLNASIKLPDEIFLSIFSKPKKDKMKDRIEKIKVGELVTFVPKWGLGYSVEGKIYDTPEGERTLDDEIKSIDVWNKDGYIGTLPQGTYNILSKWIEIGRLDYEASISSCIPFIKRRLPKISIHINAIRKFK